MATPLDDAALDVIFRQARTQNKWLDKPVPTEQLVALYLCHLAGGEGTPRSPRPRRQSTEGDRGTGDGDHRL